LDSNPIFASASWYSGADSATRTAAGPQGFQEHIVDGKLVLTLDDAIRLAMANNIDIRVDQATVDFAKNNVYRQSALFDPLASASFVDQRVKTQTSSQLQGAAVLNTLNQTTQFGYAQTFPTGTNFQTFFGNLKIVNE